MNSSRPGLVLRVIFRAPVRLYEHNLGWLLGRRFVCLTHIGRRSGRRYRTVLEAIGSDQPVIRPVLSRLLGWRYDGTNHARQRMVHQLPVVSTEPRPRKVMRWRTRRLPRPQSAGGGVVLRQVLQRQHQRH